MKLRTRLILLVLCMVMPIMISVTWMLLNKAETFFYHQADQHLKSHLTLIETQLFDKSEEIKRIANVISKRSNIQKTLYLGTSLGINQTLNKITKIYPFFNYLMIVDKEGEVYASNTLNATGEKINGEMLLGLKLNINSDYKNLFDTEPRSAIPSPDILLKTIGQITIFSQWYAAPVHKGKQLLGWVVVSYDWHHQINHLLGQSRQQLQQQNEPINEIVLLDTDQRILAGGEQGSSWFSDDKNWIGKKPITILTKEFMLIISSDKTQVLQPLIKAKPNIMIAVIITTFILLMGLYFIITYSLIRKISKLSKATEIFKEGTFSYRVESLGTDELGDLANSFNMMFDALEEANTDLEKKVSEQTTDIQKQKVELERSNKELDDFAYITSHDLKAPLRGINQIATWITEDIDDKEETNKHIQAMQQRIKRMENLLNDLLEYSRIGRTDTHYKEVNVHKLLDISFDLATPPSAFQLELADQLPIFETIAVPFEQVLRNLINNAVKHHDREDGKITVTVEDKDDHYLFKIQDDGPGIERKYHQKIFNMFQTLKPRDQVEGSGMGLAMIQKITATYGGSISLESDKGEGACFCLLWPKSMENIKINTINSSVDT